MNTWNDDEKKKKSRKKTIIILIAIILALAIPIVSFAMVMLNKLNNFKIDEATEEDIINSVEAHFSHFDKHEYYVDSGVPEIYDEYDFEELTIGQAKTKGKNIIAVTNAYSSGYINISTNLESGKVHYVVIRDDQIDGRYVCEIGENNFTHRMKKGSLYIVKILAEHAVENNFVYYRTFD